MDRKTRFVVSKENSCGAKRSFDVSKNLPKIKADHLGEGLLLYSSKNLDSTVIHLGALGDDGFTMNGANDYSGHSVSGAGDVNGDGFVDVIIGAPNATISYVVFGSNKETLQGTNNSLEKINENYYLKINLLQMKSLRNLNFG